jgi:hypothetical protein
MQRCEGVAGTLTRADRRVRPDEEQRQVRPESRERRRVGWMHVLLMSGVDGDRHADGEGWLASR